MKTLLVIYSKTGNTRAVGKEIAERLGADIEEIMDIRPRKGLFGFIRSGFEALRCKPAEIRQPSIAPKEYDLVILGTPIWAGRMSSPVRAYLQQLSGSFSNAAFFCTCSGQDYESVMKDMANVAKAEPVATLEVSKEKLVSQELASLLDKFVDRISSAH
jgi:flavodoxin